MCSVKFGIVFFSGKEGSPSWRGVSYIQIPLCFHRNLASIQLHYCDFSFLQLFFHGFLCKAGQKPRQPAVFFPRAIILARQWPCSLSDCPSSSLKGDPGKEIPGRWACRYSLGTPLAAVTSQHKIPAPPRLHWRKPWMPPTPVTLSAPKEPCWPPRLSSLTAI